MMELQLKNLSYTYPNQNSVFDGLNHVFEKGKLTVITGKNGCGKSTLLKLMAGLIAPSNGHALLNNQELSTIVPAARVQHIAYLPQNIRHFFTFKTGREQLTFTLENIQIPQDKIDSYVDKIIIQNSLSSLIDRPVSTLSGGELQQIALAIIFSLNPDYLLLDEPFVNLDSAHQNQLINMLKSQKKKSTIIIVDHRLHFYKDLADQWFRLEKNALRAFTPSIYPPAVSRVTKEPSLESADLFWKNLFIANDKQTLIEKNNFALPHGTIGLLTGPNGYGKTTLFNSLTKQHAYSGKIFFDDFEEQNISTKKWMQFVNIGFQNSENQFIKTTVREEVKSAKKASHQRSFWNNQQIDHWIDKLSLSSIIDESPYFISGGQQKKVQLLILAILSAPVILMDEIFSGLDDTALQTAWELLFELKKLGCSILIIDHQYSALEYYDYVLKINNHHELKLLQKGDAINETDAN